MKKLLALFLAALMLFSITACGGDDEEKESKKDSIGEARTLIEEGKYEEAYNLLSEIDTDESRKLLENFVVRYENWETRATNILDGQEEISTGKVIFKYDKYGNPLSENIEADDMVMQVSVEYEYDDRGNVIWTNTITAYEYFFDGETQQYEYIEINEYKYNQDNVMIYKATQNEGAEKRVTEYDNKGNIILDNGERYTCNYDKNGNLLRHTNEETGRYVIYEYDKKGNVAREEEYYSNKLSGVTEYEYDKNGNETLRIYYDANGYVERRVESEYDRFGHELFSAAYEADGSLAYKDEYKYSNPVYFYIEK